MKQIGHSVLVEEAARLPANGPDAPDDRGVIIVSNGPQQNADQCTHAYKMYTTYLLIESDAARRSAQATPRTTLTTLGIL